MTFHRYKNQLALKIIGVKGQEALSNSSVLIVGCGALGSVQAELAARAGIGNLTIVDRDIVELSNLQRQFLFDESDAKKLIPKAVAAEKRIRKINSNIKVKGVVLDLTSKNITELVSATDLILDGTDNFHTRYLINDVSVKFGRPWIYGGVIETSGIVLTVNPGKGPCLRCVFPVPPEAGTFPTCETTGVLASASVWVASLQISEAIKLLTGNAGEMNRLTTLDALQGRSHKIDVKATPECKCCKHKNFEFLNSKGLEEVILCSKNAVQIKLNQKELNLEALMDSLKQHGKVKRSGLIIEFSIPDYRLIIFPDSRIVIEGTVDKSIARSIIAKYIGV